MKKVLLGILTLIPVIVLLVVAMVSNIVALQAHISVEDVFLRLKSTGEDAYDISLSFDSIRQKTFSITDYIDVVVYPQRANNYTLEYELSGDILYTDVEYEDNRNEYLQERAALVNQLEEEVSTGIFEDEKHREAFYIVRGKFLDSSQIVNAMADLLLSKVRPAVSFVDASDNEVATNNTGRMLVASYCNFTVRVIAENVFKTLNVSVTGDDVEKVSVVSKSGNTLQVGQNIRLLPVYTPIDSIVEHTIWQSSDENVASVDQNGVVNATGEGSATISLFASVNSSCKSENTEYVKGVFEIFVSKNGASSKFFEKISTSKSEFTLEDIGVDASDIVGVEGATLDDTGIVSMTSNKAAISLKNGKQFVIESCFSNDLIIKNAQFFAKYGGFVLSVDESLLKLELAWADMLEEGAPQNAIWTSSDTDVAIVDENGFVKGISDGSVVVTATVGEASVSVELNVQKKLASIQLRTSNSALEIGIAKETVFASERYSDVSLGNEKTANYTNVIVKGEPQNQALLKDFYAAYKFEIVSGAQYARFDDEVANKLIFLPTLEDVGKQNIVVRVSARYPKYEGFTKFTTEEVTIKAVFGVQCSNIAEARQATKDQREYAHKDGNLQSRKNVFEKEIAGVGYAVYDAPRSRNLYAICLADNIVYEVNEDGTPVTVNGSNNLNLYGDLYGNNHIISALKQQVETHLIRINWSGVTLSNTVMRSNSIGDDGLITDAEDTEGFTSTVCEVICGYDWDTNRLNDVCIEYCIFENAKQAITLFNVDATVNGCIIRNMTQVGMYIPQRMADMGDAVYPFYSHLNINNVVCSNMLGSLMSVAYEKFTMKSSKLGRFADDFDENEKIFLEEFYSAGVNCVINQTGFLEAYNWQNIKNAGLLKTGNADVDGMIGSMVYDLIRENSAFDNYKYEYGGETYMHVAFICSGISFKDGIMNAPTYLQYNSQNANYSCINTADIKPEGGSTASLAATVLSRMSLKIYGYTNDASITPASTYQVNSALIERIHS